MIKRKIICFLLAVSSLTFYQSVVATTLDLTPSFPDLTIANALVDYTYDAINGGKLTITGTSMTITPDNSGDFSFITGGTYTLIANFNTFGLWDSSGPDNTVIATGTALGVPSPVAGFSSGTIVTGDLFNFGFGGGVDTLGDPENAGIFEFEFDNVGGDMAAFGDFGGIIISMLAGTDPDFGGDWDADNDTVNVFFQRSFTADANIDTFVPVPAAIWLFLSGILGLLGIARRQRKL